MDVDLLIVVNRNLAQGLDLAQEEMVVIADEEMKVGGEVIDDLVLDLVIVHTVVLDLVPVIDLVVILEIVVDICYKCLFN